MERQRNFAALMKRQGKLPRLNTAMRVPYNCCSTHNCRH